MTGPTGDRGTASGSRGARVRLAAGAVLVLVFVAGMGIGWSMGRRYHPPRRGGGPPGPFGMIGGRDLVTRLHLTPAESVAVDSAFKRRLPQADAFWRGPAGAQWRAILDSTRSDMRAALPPDKRVTFDSLMARGRRPRGG